MFATNSLNMAVEELWQLALSCATLKYILGTVAEEVTNASTEFEEHQCLTNYLLQTPTMNQENIHLPW